MGSMELKSILGYDDQGLVAAPEKKDESPLNTLYSSGSGSFEPPLKALYSSGSGTFEPNLKALYTSGSGSYYRRVMKNTVVNSIRTVVFSSRLNLLMPFGPLAIVVDKVTSHHVSCLNLFLCIYVLDCMFVYLLLECMPGLGLPSKLVGHHTFGGAVRICYRV